tara:strand:+ start:1490 stop:1672 length:183 start_codon:yes stop_codon:yes gene_type:complete
MVKKGKTKKIPEMKDNPIYKQGLNYNIEKAIKPDKIVPNNIFDGFVKSKKPKNVKKNTKK